MQKNTMLLEWHDRSLLIHSYAKQSAVINTRLEKALRYTKKSMQPDPKTYGRTQKIKREIINVYNVYKETVDENEDLCVYQTHQGLLDYVCNILKQNQCPFKILDYRTQYQKPDLEAMKGFRFNQREVLEKGLLKERSGLIKAPTRYGKTVLMTNCINAYPGLKILMVGPGLEVLKSTKETVEKYCPHVDVKLLCSGSRDKVEGDDVTICSFDSMHRIDKSDYDLVLVDEPHMAVTDSRAYHFAEFTKARIIGFGATTEDRWSGNDILIQGLIGPVLSEVTYQECVTLGALCPIHVYMVIHEFKPKGYSDRHTAYNNYMYKSESFNELVGTICNDIIPSSYQTLAFIKHEKQAVALAPYIHNVTIAMDKRFANKKEREEVFEHLRLNEIKRCLCSDIYSTGVTINDIKAELNCAGGGGNIMSVQKPGRLAEVKPGKKEGIMIDFLCMPKGGVGLSNIDDIMYNDSIARLKKYKEKGYIITIINDLEHLKNEIVL